MFKISGPRVSKLFIICSYFKSLKFFRTSKTDLNLTIFAKVAHKSRKTKIFSKYLNRILIFNKFSSNDLQLLFMNIGGTKDPITPSSLIL